MTIWEAIEERHTVRQFTDEAVEEEALEALQERIRALNAEFGLKLSLHANEELQLWPGMTLFFSSGVENFILLADPTAARRPSGSATAVRTFCCWHSRRVLTPGGSAAPTA